MPRYLVILTLVACLAAPLALWAQTRLKDPLDYSLKTYGLILAIALLGGFAGWYGKVRKGDIPGWSMFHLMGELMTSALAGLLCFWMCEWWGMAPLLTAACTGVAGHMGTRAISLFEQWAAARAKKAGL